MDIKNINKRLKNIRNAGLPSPTTFNYVIEAFNPLIRPPYLEGGGLLRSYKESVKTLANQTGQTTESVAKSFSKTDYQELLTSFNNLYGENLYVSTIKKNEHTKMIKTIEHAMSLGYNIKGGHSIDVSKKIPYDKLILAFRNAEERMIAEGLDSDQFYKILFEEMAKI